MSPAVRSLRIQRGSYKAEKRAEAAVHIISASRFKDLESEIERLKHALEEARSSVAEEAARLAETKVDEAYKRGFDEGFNKGRGTVEEAADLIRTLSGEIAAGLTVVWDNCREKSIELALTIARKIVGTTAYEHEGLARELAGKCVSMVRDQARIKVLVNPEDAGVLREASVELMSLAEGVKEIEIAERSSVKRGGVIIETEGGQVDARLEEQLSVIEAALKPGWSSPNAETNDDNQTS